MEKIHVRKIDVYTDTHTHILPNKLGEKVKYTNNHTQNGQIPAVENYVVFSENILRSQGVNLCKIGILVWELELNY